MRLAWLTDIHLNFVTDEQIDVLCESVNAGGAEAALIGGDIAEAHDLIGHLEGLDGRLGVPVHFVLGNHDFYRGRITDVREAARSVSARRPNLRWLPASGVVPLTPNTALVGHDGWADGRIGDYDASPLVLNDYRLIEDFAGLDRRERRVKLEELGDEAADHLRRVVPQALGEFKRVIVLTHVPPFREACRHPGRFAWDDWLPHFTCRAMGDVLVQAADQFPDREITVLCGHVHSASDVSIRPNLRAVTGAAEYRRPIVQRALSVD